MKARKLLSKCGYSFEKVALKTFDFAPVISFYNRKNTFSIERPSLDLIPLLEDIRRLLKGLHKDAPSLIEKGETLFERIF